MATPRRPQKKLKEDHISTLLTANVLPLVSAADLAATSCTDTFDYYKNPCFYTTVNVCRNMQLKLVKSDNIPPNHYDLHLFIVIDRSGSMSDGIQALKEAIQKIVILKDGLRIMLSMILYSDVGDPPFEFLIPYMNLTIDEAVQILSQVKVDGGGMGSEESSLAAIKIAQQFHRLMRVNIPLMIINITDEDRRTPAQYQAHKTCRGSVHFSLADFKGTGIERQVCGEAQSLLQLGISLEGLTHDGSPLESWDDIFILHICIKHPYTTAPNISRDMSERIMTVTTTATKDIDAIILDYLYNIYIRSPFTDKEKKVARAYYRQEHSAQDQVTYQSVYEKLIRSADYTTNHNPLTSLNRNDSVQTRLRERFDTLDSTFINTILREMTKPRPAMHMGILGSFFHVFKTAARTSDRVNSILSDRLLPTHTIRILFNRCYIESCSMELPCARCRKGLRYVANPLFVVCSQSLEKLSSARLDTVQSLEEVRAFVEALTVSEVATVDRQDVTHYRVIPDVDIHDDADIIAITELYHHWQVIPGSRQAEMFKFFLQQYGPEQFENIECDVNVILNSPETQQLLPVYYTDVGYTQTILNMLMSSYTYLQYVINGFSVKLTTAMSIPCRIHTQRTYRQYNELHEPYSLACESCQTSHALSYMSIFEGQVKETIQYFKGAAAASATADEELSANEQHPAYVEDLCESMRKLSCTYDLTTGPYKCMTQQYNMPKENRNYLGHYFFQCAQCDLWYYVSQERPSLTNGEQKAMCPPCVASMTHEMSIIIKCPTHGDVWWGIHHYNQVPPEACIFCQCPAYTTHPITGTSYPTDVPLHTLIDDSDFATILQTTYCPGITIPVTPEITMLRKQVNVKFQSVYSIFTAMALPSTLPPFTPAVDTIRCGDTAVYIPKTMIERLVATKADKGVTVDRFVERMITCEVGCILCSKMGVILRKMCQACDAYYCHTCFFQLVKTKMDQMKSSTDFIPAPEWLMLKCIGCQNGNPWTLHVSSIQPKYVEGIENVAEQRDWFIATIAAFPARAKAPIIKFCTYCQKVRLHALGPRNACCGQAMEVDDTGYLCGICIPTPDRIPPLHGEEYEKMLQFRPNIDAAKMYRENNDRVMVESLVDNMPGSISLNLAQLTLLCEATLLKFEYQNKIKSHRPCPGCQAMLVKMSDCGSVKCQICRLEFCWICCPQDPSTKRECSLHNNLVESLCLFPVEGKLVLTQLYHYCGNCIGNDYSRSDDLHLSILYAQREYIKNVIKTPPSSGTPMLTLKQIADVFLHWSLF
ncbi:hypothetical protein CcNV_050 [Crangon crangon nudivirus]|uniref:VWFA domain-containing protein n=1 Tax=Crangon crangon nudivirus TaxID=2880838 RepID=A0AAE8Y034_9VIRU|nr:hypothetical protein QKT25_gp050 [Crangon crangon nudivirus]UBZ25534.1 hypothetical protein CcNV_050 [Crangon crangon nudivirus]